MQSLMTCEGGGTVVLTAEALSACCGCPCLDRKSSRAEKCAFKLLLQTLTYFKSLEKVQSFQGTARWQASGNLGGCCRPNSAVVRLPSGRGLRPDEDSHRPWTAGMQQTAFPFLPSNFSQMSCLATWITVHDVTVNFADQ